MFLLAARRMGVAPSGAWCSRMLRLALPAPVRGMQVVCVPSRALSQTQAS